MRKISFDLYEFSELTPKAQEVALEAHKQEMQSQWNPRLLKAEWKKKLEALGFEDVSLEYDLGYSQGSGARFLAERFDMEKVMRSAGLVEKFPAFYEEVRAEGCTSAVVNIPHGGSYCHQGTVTIQFDYYLEGTLAEKEEEEATDALKEYVRDLCREFYEALKNDYEVLWDDEVPKADLLEQDFEFYEDGKRCDD
jgi:hypothetical protein